MEHMPHARTWSLGFHFIAVPTIHAI